MARKRMIDPSIWSDDGMAELSARQQLLYIGLFSNADDAGRLKGSPVALRLLLPGVYGGCDLDEIRDDLTAVLGAMRQLRRYQVDGRDYLVFDNYPTWQKIDKPSPSLLPAPPDESESVQELVGDGSPNAQEPFVPNRIEKKLTEQNGTEERAAAAAPRSREPDLLFESIVAACYERPIDDLTESERGRANRATRELRATEATPEQVMARAAEQRARSPGYPLTPQTLTKAWNDLAITRGELHGRSATQAPDGPARTAAAARNGHHRPAAIADDYDGAVRARAAPARDGPAGNPVAHRRDSS